MNKNNLPRVKMIQIDAEQAGQRIDNFLMKTLKGIPKSRIYRALRKGEVRVNKGRIKPEYKLEAGDEVRIPPIRVPEEQPRAEPSQQAIEYLERRIMLEDEQFLMIDKPSGIPVHGGTNVSWGLIEMLRLLRPQAKLLELVHRLDRDTSGCLLIAKKRSMLLEFHRLLTDRKVKKQYLLLVHGRWSKPERITAPLLKNQLKSGERIVTVDPEGKAAETLFRPIEIYRDATLMEALPITGRTHQIRVHAKHAGHPIAGDEKYGDRRFNRQMRDLGLKRLFLHSAGISCKLSIPEPRHLALCARLDGELLACLKRLMTI